MSRHSFRTGRILCLLLLLAVSSPFALAAEAQGEQVQIAVNQIDGRGWPDVTLNLTLTGPDGKALPGVQPGQFEVREENQPQAIQGLALGPAKNIPLALVLAMDISGSMDGEKLAKAKEAAIAFLAPLRPEDSAALVAFNSQIRTVVPSTNDKAALQLGINSLQAGGNTAAYDALYRCAQLVTGAKAGARRAIVLLTDGADTSSKYAAGVAAQAAKDSGALVYTIGLGQDANDGVLKSLAEPSGGKYYKAPAPADLQGVYTAISVELSSQMLLTYKSSTRVERSYQLITVQLKYTSPTGQVIVRSLRYRPPIGSLATGTSNTIPVPTEPPLPTFVPPVYATPTPQPAALAGAVSGGPPDIWSVAAGVLAALAAALLALGLAARLSPSLVSQRLTRYMGDAPVQAAEQPQAQKPGFGNRVLVPALKGAGRRLARLSPKGYADHIQQQLVLAGPPYRLQFSDFLGIQAGLAILLGVPFVWYAVRTAPGMPAQWVLAGLLALVMGIYFPYAILTRRVRARQAAILRALPGALDFLAINVEAGMGFDAAMSEVTRRWRNPLTEEFSLLLIDFQIGKPRREAWRDLIQRTQVPDLTAFITAMLQNEQVGSSIGALLRTQAEQMRVRRRQRAEAAARVAPVKMLLPLVFFVFPGILVVLLGPAIPQFLDAFTNLGR